MVESAVNYIARIDERPYYYLHETPPDTPWRNTRGDTRTVAIENARTLDPPPTLDDRGFTVVHHETRVDDLYDTERVRDAYYGEMEELVARVTNAARVIAFDHNVRHAELAQQPDTVAQNPVHLVHNDYTEASGPQRVRDLVSANEVEDLLRGRFAVINVWKPIRGPVRVAPLAICDATSMSASDFVETDLRYPDRTGEIYSVVFNPSHRWFYYPDMQANEAMLLKCYDSDSDRARFTAHTAFEDPASEPGAPPRESIEVRTMAFFS